MSDRLKLVIYTVLVGTKEELNNPLHYLGDQGETDLELEFVCFTDNLALTSPTWNMRAFNHPLVPAEKMSRQPKALPHKFFPDYEYSLYIDNTVVLKRLPQRADIEAALFRGFRHPWRSSPLDEADIVAKSGLDGIDVVAAQVRFYQRQAPMDTVGRLTAGTVLLRKHHDPKVRHFGELWWEQILLFSKRDQLSLDVCAREAGCPVEYFEGDKTSNELFIWPVLPNGRRVQGNFDAERYAWEHRSDPMAKAQPKQHFLTNGGEDERYTKRVALFRYACERVEAGLANAVPPRRDIADIVGDTLATFGNRPVQVLLVGILSAAIFSADADEMTATQAAVQQFFRFGPVPDVTVAAIGAHELLESAPFQAAQGKSQFDAVIVVGMPAACHAYALSKFLPLLGGEGRLLVHFGEGLGLREIEQMQSAVPAGYGLDIFHSRHIATEHIIPSSVFLLSAAS